MSAPAAKKKKSRKGLLVLLLIMASAIVLVIPPALAGGLMVPVSKVVFKETTGSLSATQATANVSLITAYEYYFSIRTQGMFRTSDTIFFQTEDGIRNLAVTGVQTCALPI